MKSLVTNNTGDLRSQLIVSFIFAYIAIIHFFILTFFCFYLYDLCMEGKLALSKLVLLALQHH